MTLPGTPYPGNPDLSPEVQQRILSTFEQTLELARGGRRQEAVLGCDFVLQLDPSFRPARRLLDRLGSGEGPVPVGDLGAEDAGGEAELDHGLPGLEEIPDFDALDDLPDLGPGLGPDVEDGGAGGDLEAQLAGHLAARRFQEAVALAEARREEVMADPALAELARTAAARQEAAHYADGFLASARHARHRGEEREAHALEEKVRALDPDHPGLAAAPAPAPRAGARDPFGLDQGELQGEPQGEPQGEEEQRIHALLAEGQEAFGGGDHQGAIDAWSRIFLIDIDHREAARRIEEARRLKAEHERRAEEIYHDAERALDGGDRESARRDLARVLQMVPGHLVARQQLDRLDDPDAYAAKLSPPAHLAAAAGADEPLREEILVPPEPGEVPATPAPPRTRAAARSAPTLRFALIGSVVLVAVLAVSWLVWANRASIFPNSDEASAPVVEDDPIARATRLHQAGRTAIAINQLRRLPPDSPQYQEAQALISQWEAAEAEVVPEASAAEGADAAARRESLMTEARAAADEGDYLRAADRLLEADRLAPLGPESAELQTLVERELAPVAPLVDLVRQGEFARALPDLWRRWEGSDGTDRLAGRLIIDAYYSMAVRELQRGDAASAADYLDEALTVSPADPVLLRHHRFAETYAQRDKDLLYRIYVKHLPPR